MSLLNLQYIFCDAVTSSNMSRPVTVSRTAVYLCVINGIRMPSGLRCLVTSTRDVTLTPLGMCHGVTNRGGKEALNQEIV